MGKRYGRGGLGTRERRIVIESFGSSMRLM